MEYQKQLDILKLLYGDNVEEYISTFSIGCLNNGRMKEMRFRTSEIEEIAKLVFSTRCDYYMTANSIKNGSRRLKSSIFGLHNICIDIDLHNFKGNINQIAKDLKYFLLDGDLDFPIPNILCKTGRGIHLWWHFEEASSKLLWMYQTVVQIIINKLEALIKAVETLSNLKIDVSASSNVVGYFRLPFTTNTKTTTLAVAEILTDEVYNLAEMFDYYCKDELKQFEKEKNQDTKPFKKNQDEDNIQYRPLHMKRKKFIEEYCKRRDYDVTGSRDLVMFLYCVSLIQLMDIDFVMLSMKKLNKQFKEPLEQSELDNIFNYMQKKEYIKFKKETFLSFLPNITDEERNEYISAKKHNGTRDTQRKVSKDERNQNIIKLAVNGKTAEQIATEVGCSARTVKNIIKESNFNRSNDYKEQAIKLKNQGLTIKSIAEKLQLSERTIKRFFQK